MIDANDTEYSLPEEIRVCPETAAAPPEMKNTAHDPFAAPEEFAVAPPIAGKPRGKKDGGKEKEEEQKSRTAELFRRVIIATAASAVATVSIVLSSFGNDPLGRDFLIHDDYWRDEEYQNEHHDNNGSYRDPNGIAEPEDPADGATFKVFHLKLNTPHGTLEMQWPEDLYEEEIDCYYAESTEYMREENYRQMTEWLSQNGGDPDSLKLVECKIQYLKTVKSEDYLSVGDEDDQENQYVLRGSTIKIYRKDLFYTASTAEPQQPETDTGERRYSDRDSADDAYPKLINLAKNGIEDFIIFEYPDGSVQWIYAGSERQPSGTTPGSIPGASYDEDTNTLTLENFTGGLLNVNMMGNGFKLKLVGDNHLEGILVWGYYYGGSLTVIGPGSLTLNENRNLSVGLELRAEDSESCLIIDQTVEKLEIFGGAEPVGEKWQDQTAAIIVRDTLLDKGIYYLSPLKLNAPTYRMLRSTSDDGTVMRYTFSLSNGFNTDELPEGYGDLARHVIFSQSGEKWAPEEEYRDYLDNN